MPLAPRPPAVPTSLQRPLGDFAAVDTEPGAVVGRHLDLVVGPDDEVLQQQVVDVGVRDVLELVPDGQPGQAVPAGNGEGTGVDSHCPPDLPVGLDVLGVCASDRQPRARVAVQPRSLCL